MSVHRPVSDASHSLDLLLCFGTLIGGDVLYVAATAGCDLDGARLAGWYSSSMLGKRA